MTESILPVKVKETLRQACREQGMSIREGFVRRTSSRFCLGVEHGDYNGTELFGVGTDRFIWMVYQPRTDRRLRLYSCNVPDAGVVEWDMHDLPVPPDSQRISDWGKFPAGAAWVMQETGLRLETGMDAIVYGNIPGGGMSRSASLTLNLLSCLLDVNRVEVRDAMQLVDWAQKVENDYIGSPCGKLDQIMILMARAEQGTYYDPAKAEVRYISLGQTPFPFRFVVMDTGTVRQGLETSTYKIRRQECEAFAAFLRSEGYKIEHLGDIRDQTVFEQIMLRYQKTHPDWCRRLDYLYHAQQRFAVMLKAWEQGDIATVGRVFREDGIGLRDDYQISGPELETMCDIARSVPGVLGERMLGGGDKGASGAIVRADAVETLREKIKREYPQKHPAYAEAFAIHECRLVQGMVKGQAGIRLDD